MRSFEPALCAHQKKSFSILRYPVIRGIEHLIREHYVITGVTESRNELFKKLRMLSKSQPFDILKNTILRLQFFYDSHVMENELISWIIQGTLSN